MYNTLSELPSAEKFQKTESQPELILTDRHSSLSSKADDEDCLERDFNQTSKDILTYLNAH